MNSTIDQEKLQTLMGSMLKEMGAAAMGPLVILGDKLGLYRSLAQSGPLTSDELAAATETAERYCREWLAANAASGYISYNEEENSFFMTTEQKVVFADKESPFLMTGGYYSISAIFHDEPKLAEAFKTGKGVSWENHNNCLFCGVEQFYRPSYLGSLLQSWIPALQGVEEKLKRGAKVADVGCGHGSSTIIMANAFPKSDFKGFDFHGPSIDHANELAKDISNTNFEKALAKSFPGEGYDFVTMFDCLHDLGDPVGALKRIYEVLDDDGTCMIVEPNAKDAMHDNFNDLGRIFYASSTMICTPNALSQDQGYALGAQAGPAKLKQAMHEAGFEYAEVCVETPFNLIFELKKKAI